MTVVTRAEYSELAGEYYDSNRHPTCANFRQASRLVLARWRVLLGSGSLVCEVGSGCSLLRETLAGETAGPALLLTDRSAGMLAYSSSSPRGSAVFLAGADARSLPLRDGSADALVSVLGDAYNETAFWREAARVVRPSGFVVFISPSYEWVTSFRGDVFPDVAEFELGDGQLVAVESLICSQAEQVALMAEAGLCVIEIVGVPRWQVEEPVSPKLLGIPPDYPIVSGYLATRPT